MQMVATGQNQVSENYAVDEIIPNNQVFNQFNTTKTFEIPFLGDSHEDSFMEFSVKALPEGFRWRQWAPVRFIAQAELIVGGSTIEVRTAENYMLGMFLTKNTIRDEALIEHLDPRREHTMIVPISFRSLPLPLVAMRHSFVSIKITLNKPEELIESETGEVIEDPLTYAYLYTKYRYYDTAERRQIAATRREWHHSTFQTATSAVNVIDKQAMFTYSQEGVSTASIIHIAAEDGSELAEPVLENVKLLLNGYERQSLTGTISRVYERAQFNQNIAKKYNWTLRDDTLSKNLYFLTYATGREDVNGQLQGLNFSRIDHSSFQLTFKEGGPARVRITVTNDIINILRAYDGMVTLRNTSIQPLFGRRTTFGRTLVDVNNILSGGKVDISGGDVCPITLNYFRNGMNALRCTSCMHCFTESAMLEWFAKKVTASHNCPYCRKELSYDSLLRVEVNIIGDVPEEPAEIILTDDSTQLLSEGLRHRGSATVAPAVVNRQQTNHQNGCAIM